jgi:hypothetical protein
MSFALTGRNKKRKPKPPKPLANAKRLAKAQGGLWR